MKQQECIPVGCVPSAALAILGGVSAQGGVCPRGCMPGGVLYTSPVDRQTPVKTTVADGN